VAPSQGPPQTRQYASPRELIDHYLLAQSKLRAQGWRPRADLGMLG
jgi:hypothetical protein